MLLKLDLLVNYRAGERIDQDVLACSCGTEDTNTDLYVGLSPAPNAKIPNPDRQLATDQRLWDLPTRACFQG